MHERGQARPAVLKTDRPAPPPAEDVLALAVRALAEDLHGAAVAHPDPGQDLTARLVPAEAAGTARIITREAMVQAGRPYVDAVFAEVDPRCRLHWRAEDGTAHGAGDTLFTVDGPWRALLTAERSALNLLQTLSGTATTTAHWVQLLAGTRCQLLDTRKTLPGLRIAQKYAVRCGGGHNHRLGLYDAILVKENHIAAAGSIPAAVSAARAIDARAPVEVEVESLAEFDAALAAGADLVLLDEFTDADLREAVRRNEAAGRRMKLEASGGVSEATLPRIAATGVDFVSVGALTKHLRAIDLSMRYA